MRFFKKLLQFWWVWGSLLLCACQDQPTFSVDVSTNDPSETVFAANVGNTNSITYNVVLNDASLANNEGGTFDVVLSTLPSSLTQTANTCQGIQAGQTCQITLEFAPQSSSDYFENVPVTFSIVGASGATTLDLSGVPATLSVTTQDYASDKTAMNIYVGGSVTPAFAEIDTGSDISVVEDSYVGPNVQRTNIPVTITYDQGQNPVTGYLAYGSISMQTTTGQILASSSSTPIVIVADGSIGSDGNTAILGMEMDNQVSMKLFLPYPYNQMMVLNHMGQLLTFGVLTESQIAQYATVQLDPLSAATCSNHIAVVSLDTTCWNDRAIPVNYVVSGGPPQGTVYDTLFDSGASHTSFQLPTVPSYMTFGSNGYLTNTVNPTLTATGGTINFSVTSEVKAETDSSNMVNSGNMIFTEFIELLDQRDGKIGFVSN